MAVVTLLGVGLPSSVEAAPAGFITRSGSALKLDGRTFRFVGFNVYNANSSGNCNYGMDRLGSSLHEMGAEQGVFRAWFYQSLATKSGKRDWSVFDRTLASARDAGLKVVVTFADQWGYCEGWPSDQDGYRTENFYKSAYKTSPTAPGLPSTYRQWVSEVVTRYRSSPTVAMWQLMNEAEAKSSRNGSCPSTAASSLKSFASDVASVVKGLDPNHLLSLGSIGTGQCGMSTGEYKVVHSVSGIDLCEYHDYSADSMPGDRWNGLSARLQQCRELGKPLFVGESGIATSWVGSLAARANKWDSKITTQMNAGVSGFLLWNWRDGAQGGSSPTGYEVGPNDPVLPLPRV